MKVYYLDDEPDLCDLFQEYLELADIEVETFTDARSAIAACEESPPAVIFIDYRLADTTGDLVARSIAPNIPKVLVTGDLGKSKTEAFAAIIEKPFRLAELLKHIRALTNFK